MTQDLNRPNPFLTLFQKSGLVILISIISTHLDGEESFPTHPEYSFPWFYVLLNSVLGVLVIILAERWFYRCTDRYFKLGRFGLGIRFFLGGVFGVLLLCYVPAYFFALYYEKEIFAGYDFVSGLLLSLLLITVFLALFYGVDLFYWAKREAAEKVFHLKYGKQLRLVPHSDLRYFYTEHNVVYLVVADGNRYPTDFTLNQLEDTPELEVFFRANRQTLICKASLESYTPLKNGQLQLELKPEAIDSEAHRPKISRHKKQPLLQWFHT